MNKLKEGSRNRFLKIVIISGILFGINYFFSFYRLFSDSMDPNLEVGSYVVALNDNNPKQGDIISYRREDNLYIKRVVALEGQTVDIDKNGNLFVNGQFVSEAYIAQPSLHPISISLPYKVPDDTYFVLGDNRKNALDSRTDLVGTINQKEITGKLIFQIFPFNKFGIID